METLGKPTRCEHCGSWRRPALMCACGHSASSHRIDLKTKTCDTGGCACKQFELKT